ncbi:hypothetical protein D3C77_478550 [compost metagenome]
MTIAERTQKNTLATGSVTAMLIRSGSLPEDFNATFFDVYKLNDELHIWAQQGTSEFFDAVFLRIPFDTPDGDYDVEPGGTEAKGIRAAFLNKDSGDYAEIGKLSGFQWGNNKRSVRFQFEFSGKHGLRKYLITGGELEIEFGELSDLKNLKAGTGTVSATVEPPVFPNHGSFQSSGLSFQASGIENYGEIHRLYAWQTTADSEQAIVLHISNDDPETKLFGFFGIGHGGHIAKNYSLKSVEWDKENRTFKALFEFDFGPVNGKPYTVRAGTVDLSY